MISVQKYTPEVYYNNSRDFQAIGRVCEVLYNYILMNIDNMIGLPISDNTNTTLLDLALLTIGFDRHHNYTNVDLVKLSEIFKYIMKIKGTKKAIEEIVFLLLRSQNIEEEAFILNIHSLNGELRTTSWKPDSSTGKVDTFSIDLYVSNKLKDIVLIEDVFDYILPAGFIYHIYLSSTFSREVETQIKNTNNTLNFGYASNSSQMFGQIFNSTDNPDDPLVNLPNTSRTFTTTVVSSDENGEIDIDNEWKNSDSSED